MIAHQIGVVLCRVGAAVLTVQAIRSFGYALPGLVFGAEGFTTEVLAFFLLSGVPGFAAIGLWIFADRISNVADQAETKQSQQPLAGVDLVRIGTALIGMYVVILGIISAANIEVATLARPDPAEGLQTMLGEHDARMTGLRVSYFLQIAIGLALVFGRERISEMLAKAKYAGVDTK